MDFLGEVGSLIQKSIQEIYQKEVDAKLLVLSPTKKEFEGDFTLVVFPFVKILGESPETIGNKVGAHLVEHSTIVTSFNVIKGFLNLGFAAPFWHKTLTSIASNNTYGKQPSNGEKVMVEFASPNTNKPLHLGHIRNILLGWSCSQLLEEAGYEVVKAQIINDRGIAICKSMLAWKQFGEGATPTSTNIKSDHFVGDYYVTFEKKFKQEYTDWQTSDEGKAVFDANKKKDQEADAFFKEYKNQYFNHYSSLGKQANDMLLRWEANDPDTIALWKKMNQWVYDGFEVTYKNLGVHFDAIYYESNTYLLGKEIIDKGLALGVFYKKDDGSVWIDLTDAGMDYKLVLRSNGTSVYITQDIGTAHQRYKEHGTKSMVYTVADEQDYHFKVLFEIAKRLQEPYAAGLYHLSYGMVDLTTGQMKSREGTVVDADDLMEEVIAEAHNVSAERGELVDLSKEKQDEILRKIGMAALKFFIIKVNPKKRMTFDPHESLDMQGQTGPYIQNAYVRIQSVLRKNELAFGSDFSAYTDLKNIERELLAMLMDYPAKVVEAAKAYDPSIMANYCYALAKEYHRFYHEVRILNAETESAKMFRLTMSHEVGQVLNKAMNLLGIEMPEKM